MAEYQSSKTSEKQAPEAQNPAQFQYADARSATYAAIANASPQAQHVAQMQAMANGQRQSYPTLSGAPVQRMTSGLPDDLARGVESLSGQSMAGVEVHRNSSKPADMGALAFAQGNQIHLGPGQEQHLPHEAWHVAQQMQGRVEATTQAKGGTPVNDEKHLEDEADRMGAEALRVGRAGAAGVDPGAGGHVGSVQLKAVAQRVIGPNGDGKAVILKARDIIYYARRCAPRKNDNGVTYDLYETADFRTPAIFMGISEEHPGFDLREDVDEVDEPTIAVGGRRLFTHFPAVSHGQGNAFQQTPHRVGAKFRKPRKQRGNQTNPSGHDYSYPETAHAYHQAAASSKSHLAQADQSIAHGASLPLATGTMKLKASLNADLQLIAHHLLQFQQFNNPQLKTPSRALESTRRAQELQRMTNWLKVMGTRGLDMILAPTDADGRVQQDLNLSQLFPAPLDISFTPREALISMDINKAIFKITKDLRTVLIDLIGPEEADIDRRSRSGTDSAYPPSATASSAPPTASSTEAQLGAIELQDDFGSTFSSAPHLLKHHLRLAYDPSKPHLVPIDQHFVSPLFPKASLSINQQSRKRLLISMAVLMKEYNARLMDWITQHTPSATATSGNAQSATPVVSNPLIASSSSSSSMPLAPASSSSSSAPNIPNAPPDELTQVINHLNQLMKFLQQEQGNLDAVGKEFGKLNAVLQEFEAIKPNGPGQAAVLKYYRKMLELPMSRITMEQLKKLDLSVLPKIPSGDLVKNVFSKSGDQWNAHVQTALNRWAERRHGRPHYGSSDGNNCLIYGIGFALGIPMNPRLANDIRASLVDANLMGVDEDGFLPGYHRVVSIITQHVLSYIQDLTGVVPAPVTVRIESALPGIATVEVGQGQQMVELFHDGVHYWWLQPFQGLDFFDDSTEEDSGDESDYESDFDEDRLVTQKPGKVGDHWGAPLGAKSAKKAKSKPRKGARARTREEDSHRGKKSSKSPSPAASRAKKSSKRNGKSRSRSRDKPSRK